MPVPVSDLNRFVCNCFWQPMHLLQTDRQTDRQTETWGNVTSGSDLADDRSNRGRMKPNMSPVGPVVFLGHHRELTGPIRSGRVRSPWGKEADRLMTALAASAQCAVQRPADTRTHHCENTIKSTPQKDWMILTCWSWFQSILWRRRAPSAAARTHFLVFHNKSPAPQCKYRKYRKHKDRTKCSTMNR